MLEDSDEKMCSLEDVEKIRLSRHKMEKYAFKIVEYMRKYWFLIIHSSDLDGYICHFLRH